VRKAKKDERYLFRRPQLSDLRNSGSIEQDSDSVIFLHREEVHLLREKPAIEDIENYTEWQSRYSKAVGKADLIVAKQRQGAIGITALSYDAKRFMFGGADA